MNAIRLVLALGCGVNSVALLVLKKAGKVNFDLAIFADTGTEQPETYEYLENVIKPFCQQNNIELVVIQSKLGKLYDYYYNKKIIPTRIHRDCTDKFKITPMKKYCKERFPEDSIVFVMGIDAGEAHRAKTDGYYPLIDMGIDRNGCKQLIKKAGLPIPVKSGCMVCPFQPKESWLNLRKNHVEEFDKAIALEKNCKRYPEMTLYSKPLEILGHREQGNDKLCNWMERCAFCE